MGKEGGIVPSSTMKGSGLLIRPDTASPPASATVADLQVVELGLEGLDRAVRGLEVLVEAVALGDEL